MCAGQDNLKKKLFLFFFGHRDIYKSLYLYYHKYILRQYIRGPRVIYRE